MNMATTQEIVADILSANGFTKIGDPGKSNLWELSAADADVAPCFAPHLVRKRGATQILGSVGVYVRSFDAVWRDRLKRTGLDDGQIYSSFAAYVANFDSLGDPPDLYMSPIGENAEAHEWVKRIRAFVSDFPTDLETLVGQLKHRKFAAHDAKFSSLFE